MAEKRKTNPTKAVATQDEKKNQKPNFGGAQFSPPYSTEPPPPPSLVRRNLQREREERERECVCVLLLRLSRCHVSGLKVLVSVLIYYGGQY